MDTILVNKNPGFIFSIEVPEELRKINFDAINANLLWDMACFSFAANEKNPDSIYYETDDKLNVLNKLIFDFCDRDENLKISSKCLFAAEFNNLNDIQIEYWIDLNKQ